MTWQRLASLAEAVAIAQMRRVVSPSICWAASGASSIPIGSAINESSQSRAETREIASRGTFR
jgi:hypothetical protein